MIRYLKDYEKPLTEKLYREAFPEDKDAFVKYYYSYVTRDNKMLVMEQAGELCSMLHLNPYRLSVGGVETAAYYYVAVATREDCRHQGMMRKLLHRSLNDIFCEEHPFTYLMPADKAIYEPFGFREIYCQEEIELPKDPEKANQRLSELFDVYTIRDSWYVEKQLEEARVCEGEPPFEIVPYIMARITHAEKMLSMLRSTEPRRLILRIEDPIIRENSGDFLWEISQEASNCWRIEKDAELPDCVLDIAELTQFVFGKRTIGQLEGIKPFSRIYINEAV